MRFESGPGVPMIGVAITFVVAIALPIGAHHTPPPGLFNDTFSDVQGVVKEVRLRPPHAWIMVEVKGDDGVLQLWPLEGAGPTALQVIGVTPDYVKAGDDGVLQLWPLEGASPAALQGIGVTPDYVKAGDTIKVRCRRLRVIPKGHDNDCLLGFLKAKDGSVKDWSGNNAPVPADF